MKPKLIVKNLGPIKYVDLELGQVNVFIGPQASGKSTLAKIIALCNRHSHFGAKSNAEEHLFDYGIQSYLSKDSYVRYENGILTITIERGQFSCEYRNQTLEGDNSLYYPSERSIIPVVSGSFMTLTEFGASLPPSVLQFGARFERARSKIRELDKATLDFLDVKYKYEEGEDRLYLKNEKYVKLSQASSGMQASLPLLYTLSLEARDSRYSYFIVEEPEQNLYPKTQHELILKIVTNVVGVSSKKNNLTITTHSPYILTSINNCLKAYTVGQRKPTEVEKIVKKESWLNPKDFSAYYVGNGGVSSIFNKDVGLIDEEYLDSASDEIMGDFQELLDIR